MKMEWSFTLTQSKAPNCRRLAVLTFGLMLTPLLLAGLLPALGHSLFWSSGDIDLSQSDFLFAPQTQLMLILGVVFCLAGTLVARCLWRAQRQVAAQTRWQAHIFQHTAEAMMVTDLAQRILTVNPAFEQITGYSAAEAIGQMPHMLGVGSPAPGSQHEVWANVAACGAWQGEVLARRKCGEIYPKKIRIHSISSGKQKRASHYVAMFSDLSAEKALASRIDYLAHRDPLTGLPNRLAMDLFLAQVVSAAPANSPQFAVLIIDLDNFRTINDSLGHHAGDQLLRQVATRLQTQLDPQARLFRLGGDEFVVVLQNVTQRATVTELVERLIPGVRESCLIDGCELHVNLSVGISLYPVDGDSPETLIRNADTALHFAKANGRNHYQFFAEAMNAAANKRLRTESELWQALAEDQLVLEYQPQVELSSGRLVGMEALVRWQHPQLGLIAPADFIYVAEESGLILPLGNWVLLNACRQAKAWLDAGYELGEMAVNISAIQFRQPGFSQSVQAILLETGLPAARLELEITESTVMRSVDSSLTMLAELKQMGVKLAIDDFGTGYSSLSYLRQFSVDRLKIDRSFVADIETDAGAAALVSSIILLGDALGLQLVAEGVENAAQAAFLRERNCQRAQGFYYSRPLAVENVPAVSKNFSGAALNA